MSTTKIVLLVLGILAAVGLVVVLFVGGIAWFTLRGIANSQAADQARTYLRSNKKLKDDIGEVKGFGSFVNGSINVHNQDGDATLKLKVIGERKTVYATVDLMYRSNRDWRVTGATYESDGRTIDLMSAYENEPDASPTR